MNIVILLLILLTGCGLNPLYKTVPNNQVSNFLAAVEIITPKSTVGSKFNQYLQFEFNPLSLHYNTKYRLITEINHDIGAAAIQHTGQTISYNVNTRVNYKFIDFSGEVLFSDTVIENSNYNSAGSDYALYISEEDAIANNIKTIAFHIREKLTLYFLKNT